MNFNKGGTGVLEGGTGWTFIGWEGSFRGEGGMEKYGFTPNLHSPHPLNLYPPHLPMNLYKV
jgi:hypothetical protein